MLKYPFEKENRNRKFKEVSFVFSLKEDHEHKLISYSAHMIGHYVVVRFVRWFGWLVGWPWRGGHSPLFP